ncbi:hypothetical protein PybrP1_010051 [[Pythium] brassicae (nom. inval.)]|nr:hypothetical protein PybrP1_010051 [[Pythium] brassicae (nom. inval.)]
MVPAEAEALAAWTMGALPLPAPSGFLACTHAYVDRLAFTRFHKEHLEGRDKVEEYEGPADMSSVARDEAAFINPRQTPSDNKTGKQNNQPMAGSKAVVVSILFPSSPIAERATRKAQESPVQMEEAAPQAATQTAAQAAADLAKALRAEVAEKLAVAQAVANTAAASLKNASAQAHEAALQALDPLYRLLRTEAYADGARPQPTGEVAGSTGPRHPRGTAVRVNDEETTVDAEDHGETAADDEDRDVNMAGTHTEVGPFPDVSSDAESSASEQGAAATLL